MGPVSWYIQLYPLPHNLSISIGPDKKTGNYNEEFNIGQWLNLEGWKRSGSFERSWRLEPIAKQCTTAQHCSRIKKQTALLSPSGASY